MRISPSVLRDALTIPGFRIAVPSPGEKQTGGPSIDGALRSAIRQLHENGEAAARTALSASFRNGFWTSGAGLTMARQAKACFDTYVQLARGDRRDSFSGASRTWTLDSTEFSVNPDVILLDAAGYVPRICMYGALKSPLTRAQRALLAAPTIFAVAEEMDGGFGQLNVTAAQVWELRSGAAGEVSRVEAEGVVNDLRALVREIGAA